MKIIYFGSGEFGLPTLRRLAQRHTVAAVVTQPDRPSGRHKTLTATPIGACAASDLPQVPLLKWENVNDPAAVAAIRAVNADAAVVIAFGQKLGPELLAASGRLAINLHASLLPKYRGAAPINWAIINGDSETGVSIIGLSQRMDAGLIYAQEATIIGDTETAGELHDRLSAMGPALVERVLGEHDQGILSGRPQDESAATRAPKLSKADAKIDFSLDAYQIARRIHGLTPWPGIHLHWHSAQGKVQELILRRVRSEPDLSCFIGHHGQPPLGTILEGGCVKVGDGAIRLLEVQLPGKKPMSYVDFARGHPLLPGDRLQNHPLAMQ